MRDSRRNPFLDSTFSGLCDAISDAAAALRDGRFCSREDKLAFRARLHDLLLAIGMRFMVGDAIPDSPEIRLARGVGTSVADVFLPWYESKVDQDTRKVREYTMWRAADFVLRAEARAWLDPHDVLWSNRRVYMGSRDDEGLVAVLNELEAMRLDEDRPK